MFNLDVSDWCSGTPPLRGFTSLRHSLFVKDNWIRDVQFCWVLVLIFFFFCHNSFVWKNVILRKQKLLKKSYQFWQFCLEGSWGGISWKCWSSQLWHFLNGKEFWFISFSLLKMMFQKGTVLWRNKMVELKAWKKKKRNKKFEAVSQHFILQLCWLFGQHGMI